MVTKPNTEIQEAQTVDELTPLLAADATLSELSFYVRDGSETTEDDKHKHIAGDQLEMLFGGVADLADAAVATLSDRPNVADQSDGFTIKTESNGLLYRVVDGAYTQLTNEARVLADDVQNLSELVENQTVYVLDRGQKFRWNGSSLEIISSGASPGGGEPNIGLTFGVTNTGAKDHVWQVPSSFGTVTLLNRVAHTPGPVLAHIRAGEVEVIDRYKPTAGQVDLPDWFRGVGDYVGQSATYDATFFDLVEVLHKGEGYGTNLDDPEAFRQAAVADVLSQWRIENPGLAPRDYYVDPVSGSNTNPGTPSQPFATLAQAESQPDWFRTWLATGLQAIPPLQIDRSGCIEAWRRPGDQHSHAFITNWRASTGLVVAADTRPNVYKVTDTNTSVGLSGFVNLGDFDSDGFPGIGIFIDPRETTLADALDKVSETPGSWTTSLDIREYYVNWPEPPVFGRPSQPIGVTHCIGRSNDNRNVTPTGSNNLKVYLRGIHHLPQSQINSGPAGTPNRVWRQDCRYSHDTRVSGVSYTNVTNSELIEHSMHGRYGASDGFFGVGVHRVILINPTFDHVGTFKNGNSHNAISLHDDGIYLIVNPTAAIQPASSRPDETHLGTFANFNNSTVALVLGADFTGDNATTSFTAFGPWTGRAMFAGIKTRAGLRCLDGPDLLQIETVSGELRFDLSHISMLRSATIVGAEQQNLVVNTE